MRLCPSLIQLRLSKLTQKIGYFDGLGVDRDSMVKIVARFPPILCYSIDKNFAPKVQLLQSIGVVNDSLVKFLVRNPGIFGSTMENIKKNVSFFQTNGLTGEKLVKMILRRPLMLSVFVDKYLSKKLQYLVSLGFVVGSTAMGRALGYCVTVSTVLLEVRVQNLQSLGFTHEEVFELVTAQPKILKLSEKAIRVKMDYLVNTMKRAPAEILKYPVCFTLSLHSCIKPRHRAMELLASKGLLKMDKLYSLGTILYPSEENFIKRYVSLDTECLDVYLEGSEKRDLRDGKRQALGIARKREQQQRTSSQSPKI